MARTDASRSAVATTATSTSAQRQRSQRIDVGDVGNASVGHAGRELVHIAFVKVDRQDLVALSRPMRFGQMRAESVPDPNTATCISAPNRS